MRILFDTNIILDLLLDRTPFSQDAVALIEQVEMGILTGVLCATTITTIDYLICKAIGKEKARIELEKLMSMFDIAPVNRLVLETALHNGLNDFEDAVIYESAFHHGVQAIISRNLKDFKNIELPVYTAKQFLLINGS